MNFNPDLKTLDELALERQDDDYYLIEDLFPMRGLAIVSGKPGTGKQHLCFKPCSLAFRDRTFLTKIQALASCFTGFRTA